MTPYAVSRPEGPLAVAVAVGAALGATVAGVAAAQDAVDALPSMDAVSADLGLATHSTPVMDVAPVPAAAPAHVSESAADAGLAKATTLAARDAKAGDAIARFESFIGTTRYEDYCERAVENAYGTQGHYASAIDDWHARDQHSDWRHAPRGALVFYNTSSDGHVAVSLGDGRVVSSSAHHRVGIVPVDFFQHPLGWAPAPY